MGNGNEKKTTRCGKELFVVFKGNSKNKLLADNTFLRQFHQKILNMAPEERRHAIDQIFKDMLTISRTDISEELPLHEQLSRIKGRLLFRIMFEDLFGSLQVVERKQKAS